MDAFEFKFKGVYAILINSYQMVIDLLIRSKKFEDF